MAHRGVASRIAGYQAAIERLHDAAHRAEQGDGGTFNVVSSSAHAELLNQAGFTRVRLATESPVNLVIEARP